MQLLNKFFGKKKYQVDDDELVWKRTDTVYNVHQFQPQTETEPGDMVLPKHYTSNINPHPLETPKNYHTQKQQQRSSRTYDSHLTQQNNVQKSYSPVNSPHNIYANDNINQQNIYGNNYGQNMPPNYGFDNHDYNTNVGNGYNQPEVNNFNSDHKYDYPTPFTRSNLKVRSVNNQGGQLGQGFINSPQKDRNLKPELRDYYNIEENIMKKMMQQGDTEPQHVNKNVNVFGGKPKLNTEKATNHFREAVKRNPNPPILEAKLPKDIKRRQNLVFKAVDGDNQDQTVDTEPQNIPEMPEMESQYMGKSMDELQRILRERNIKLSQLEEQNFHLNNNETNVTFLQKQIQELNRETDKLREKNGHLETEQRLLYEDLMNKKDILNDLEVTLAKVSSMDQPDSQAKKDLIDRIEKNQKYIEDINNKLANYEEGKNKEIEDIKKNSEKNMQMELEEIKINIMNYDDELLKWMRYFETKVSNTTNSNALEQNIF